MLAEYPNSNNGQWGLRTKRSLPKKVSNIGEHNLISARPITISNDTSPDNFIGVAYSARGLCLDEFHNNNFILKNGCKVIKRRVNMMIDELVEAVAY